MVNMRDSWKRWSLPVILTLASLATWSWVSFSYGWKYLLLLTLTPTFALAAVALSLQRFFPEERFARVQKITVRGLVIVASIGLTLTLVEVVLTVVSHMGGADPSGSPRAVMPQAWQKRWVVVPGAKVAYMWHGILHVRNKDQMRRTVPFPAKEDGVFRIMAVGDSMTYGWGVESDAAYPAQIEVELQKTHNVEVLNLGVCGAQSEDIARTTSRFLPILKPDLVVYGVCLNDFLSSGDGVYSVRYPSLPLPRRIARQLVNKTNVGNVVESGWNAGTILVGAESNFFEDILEDFDQRRSRFANDVRAMNSEVVQSGLPPVLSMVLVVHRLPEGSDSHQVSLAAEKHMADADFNVIPSRNYILGFGDRKLVVSRWEGHPSAEAHRVFAEQFVRSILLMPELDRARFSHHSEDR